MMSLLMKDKAGLVTGGGLGIGRSTAIEFAKEGAKVMVSDISVKDGEETVRLIREFGGEAAFFPCDVTNEEQVKGLVDATLEQFGQLDFAFNNAGANGKFAPITEQDSKTWDLVMQVNVYGVFYCLKHEIATMEKTGGGAIVNTSSGAGLIAVAQNSPYNTAKFAVVGLTKSTAYDYGHRNIRVNALCPGSTRTAMMDNAIEQNGGEAFERELVKTIPMGALADPEDQAAAVVWLCSDKAKTITGVSIPVDGGYVLGK
ncbi:glucose 1-dehydrogenase [Streptococcus moroccensis]|uniref:NAD(P)-dependent dehydrogenase (Short-subunit alcohol dehydrogenase family) n=1 Tax=Streptococcus moroccensis TaxID=1451356 RepID=A0ABT9YT67_9STRE|nr:glucose 1-dehydrogenase [Streptococcus moroccensis]MDQ0222320.1 NAD(P)-dependent dehydrogenase (short-subunit alcohol dehydrogenase family) [Streptococcus moroccensis]